MNKEYHFKLNVYYEDTDAGGVVYYANYLKFIERARTDFIKKIGLSNTELRKKYKTLIIVKSCNIDFKKSAYLEDELEIYSSVKSISRTSFKMIQNIKRENIIITNAEVHLVTVDINGKPTKIPNILQKELKNLSSN